MSKTHIGCCSFYNTKEDIDKLYDALSNPNIMNELM